MAQPATNCKHCGCYCTAYVVPTSKWSKGKCKSCNHPEKDHREIHATVSFASNQRAPAPTSTQKVASKVIPPATTTAPTSSDQDEDDDALSPIVIDAGSWMIKAGFGGDDAPRAVFPSIVGKPRQKHFGVMPVKDSYVGDEANWKRAMLDLSHPIEHGIVRSWNDLETMLHHTFYNELRVAPEEQECMVTEKYMNPKTNTEKLTQILFEYFNVPSMYLAQDGILALYASGRTTGLLLNMGDGVTSCTPTYEGYVLPHAQRRVDVAGGTATEFLGKLLMMNPSASASGIDFSDSKYLMLVNDIKEKLCYVALDYEQELNQPQQSIEKEYELPDGQRIKVAHERFKCMEAVFKQNIASFVNDSIMECDVDIRADFYRNIVLAGGPTLANGFVDRLQTDLSSKMSKHHTLKIVAPPERKYTVWIGGSIVASLSTFQEMWWAKSEYDEHGPAGIWYRMSDHIAPYSDSDAKWRYIQPTDNTEYKLFMLNEENKMLRDKKSGNDTEEKLQAKDKHVANVKGKGKVNENVVAKEKYDSLLKEKSDLQRLVNELKSENNRLHRANERLQEECKDAKHQLSELQSKYDALKSQRSLDLSKYSEWSQDDVLQWMITIEDGRFEKYEAKLAKAFAEQEFDGSCLEDVTENNLLSMGVTNFKDRKSLYKHIQQLVHSNGPAPAAAAAMSEGGVTAYI